MSARTVSVLISLVGLLALLSGLVVAGGADAAPRPDDPRARMPVRPTPLDHAAFFPDPLEDGPAVTRACLACHANAAEEVMRTSHWTWAGAQATNPATGQTIAVGKRNLQNNFCISIAGNWPRCTSCHVGYGWQDESFLETAGPDRVDCLVCHDRSGQYEKSATGAGLPGPGVDLVAAARSVGRAGRENCGTCHFKGGGGDGVKHGDLDETMYMPPARVDVHMGGHGLVCTDCHRTEHHQVRGRLLPREEEPSTRVACTDCHAAAPHAEDRLNAHVATLSCQACHIPRFAVETGTKMWWDWSHAGLDGEPETIAERLVEEVRETPAARAGIPPEILALFDRVGRDADVHAHYDKKKGLFLIARRQVPEYRWYDGTSERLVPGQPTPEGVAAIARPLGQARDPQARIWPFKIHRGRQPYDLEGRHLLAPHVFGAGGYWSTFDWDRALRDGARAAGLPFSGRFGWKTTEMAWPQNHMVQPKEDALRCVDCHGAGGRMDWRALGYPGDPAFMGDRRQTDVVRPGAAEREASR